MTHLQDAQAQAWQQLQKATALEKNTATSPARTSYQDALLPLNHTLSEAQHAAQTHQVVALQSALEQLLLQTLCALKRLDVNAEAGFQRALRRQAKASHTQEPGDIYLYADRVELWINQEYRGSWRLYDEQDSTQVRQMALELGCRLHDHGANQLQLF
ncbi:MAG: hypothetical protein VKK59_06480 [Vampirovibrionales bacterium]|nr:hypothetical protein [Vampirovibrionales bacterium]